MKLTSIKNSIEKDVSHNSNIKKHQLISNGEIANITNFARAIFPPNEIAYAHSHSDMTEVFFVESGQGEILIDEKKVILESGDCITVEPNEVHELKNAGETDLVVLYFGIET